MDPFAIWPVWLIVAAFVVMLVFRSPLDDGGAG